MYLPKMDVILNGDGIRTADGSGREVITYMVDTDQGRTLVGIYVIA